MGDEKVEIFIDCGAPSLYNSLMRKGKMSKGVHAGSFFSDRKFDDFSFVETEEYDLYREEYIQFLKDAGDRIVEYSNLDVINNPKETWKNQKLLEKRGLNPIPVYHLGCNDNWLKRYLKEGYEHVAIGGIVPNPTRVVIPILHRIWKEILTDSKGVPKVKVHGFAATSIDLMFLYPWYSVDSTSWNILAIYGKIYVPRVEGGVPRYDKTPISIAISKRASNVGQFVRHFYSLEETERKKLEEMFQAKGVPLGNSEFKIVDENYELKKNERICDYYEGSGKKRIEIYHEVGLCNDWRIRCVWNSYYFQEVEKQLSEKERLFCSLEMLDIVRGE